MRALDGDDRGAGAVLAGLCLIAAALLAYWFLGSLLWASYFGPFRSIEGTVDVAREVSITGGTGVRGGDMALNVVLADRLSPTPYQPEFRLTFSPFANRSFETAQRLPRGTPVTLVFRDGDLAAALDYAGERQALEAAGERYHHSWIGPEWVVQLSRIEWQEDGETVCVFASRFATLFWSLFLLVFASAVFVVGLRGLQGYPVLRPSPGAKTP